MILVIGAGYMAREYVRVLSGLNENILVVGRGDDKVKEIRDEFNVEAVSGGIEAFIENTPLSASQAIVCTPVETLADVTISLLQYGVKRILLEKPGGLTIEELEDIERQSKQRSAEVRIGYNRRFYQSTLEAERLIDADGGLTGVNFEITEWSHVIENEKVSEEVKQKWIIANTSHVLDLAFFVAGAPKELSTFTTGALNWHSTGSRFCGAGITESDVIFSYCGFWDGPGRWSVEFITKKHKYILRPMEKLQVQSVGSIAVESVEGIDYELDSAYKPGLYLQTQAFLSDDMSRLSTINEQIDKLLVYKKIANY